MRRLVLFAVFIVVGLICFCPRGTNTNGPPNERDYVKLKKSGYLILDSIKDFLDHLLIFKKGLPASDWENFIQRILHTGEDVATVQISTVMGKIQEALQGMNQVDLSKLNDTFNLLTQFISEEELTKLFKYVVRNVDKILDSPFFQEEQKEGETSGWLPSWLTEQLQENLSSTANVD